jgi:hypothetical protein
MDLIRAVVVGANACYGVSGRYISQLRNDLWALIYGDRATGVERTSRWWIQWAWEFASQLNAFPLSLKVGVR